MGLPLDIAAELLLLPPASHAAVGDVVAASYQFGLQVIADPLEPRSVRRLVEFQHLREVISDGTVASSIVVESRCQVMSSERITTTSRCRPPGRASDTDQRPL